MTSASVLSKPAFPRALAWLAFGLVGLVLALFFGLLASTANPIFVGVGVALLVGVMVLGKPTWNIWLLLMTGLLVVGVLPIWVEGLAGKAVWGVSVLGFVLLLRALFQAAVDPQARRTTPAFVWVGLIFLLYTLINTLAHWPEAYEVFGGFKRYFQVIGLMFALAWLTIDERSVTHWRKLFVFAALVQLPWAAYELIKLVPIREGLAYAYPGMVPIDVVAGTFGANMTSGGANAEMATFLIIVLLFLLARLRTGVLPKGRLLWLAPIILAPLFMGETKAVVVLLPLAFLTLYRRELLARPHLALAGVVVGALLTVAAGYAYLGITQKSLDAQVADTLSYNVYEKGYGDYALNRTTVLTFWAGRQGLHDPAGAVFGHGLGVAHDPTGGHLARRYPGYGIGLTAAPTLLWEQGVFGTALFLAMLALAWRAAGRVQNTARAAWVKADAAAIQAALPLFALYLIYRVALLEELPFQLVFYGLLGYLAWLVRQQTRRPS
jgi:hypothetical protein